MIYKTVGQNAPLRQGDLFRNVPRLEISLDQIPVVDDKGQRVVTWSDLVASKEQNVTALVQLKPVTGIVVTQDCDAARGQDICLAFIDDFAVVTRRNPETAKSWRKHIVRQTRDNLRYFYLPADKSMGFVEPSAADFRTLLRVRREDLENLQSLRVGRLNRLAYEHFRETLSQFFRRYPYNEWYPLDKEQAEDYASEYDSVDLYPWQK